MDWCGQVIEAITGRRLGDVFRTRIFEPLGMRDTTFELTKALRQRVAGMHARNADGSLAPMDFDLPSAPEVHMGGHGLYGTVGDYMRFIRMWLNDGDGEHGRVLKAETVRMAEQNQLGDKKVTMLRSVIPALSNDAEFFPGLSKSWALTFMVNDEPAPTGRPAGALGWAGSRTCSIGSTVKTGSAGSGRRRSCHSAIRCRSPATLISRPRSTAACARSRRPDVREDRPPHQGVPIQRVAAGYKAATDRGQKTALGRSQVPRTGAEFLVFIICRDRRHLWCGVISVGR